jgi:hypothetical protein
MTTLLEKPVVTETLQVLRVAPLKEQEHAICVALWRAWANYDRITYRGLAWAAGMPLGTFNNWIYGQTRGNWSQDGLVAKGFIERRPGAQHQCLSPGPRMAGVQGNRVLELVNAL